MDDLAFGRLFRMARIRRAWRQQDLADRAGVPRSAVSRIECGRTGEMPLATVRRAAAPLDIRVELHPRARAADLDRITNARHAALEEHVARWIAGLPGWTVRPEVSFSEYGERGVIDLLCWHEATRSLLVIEVKTELIDVGHVLATVDRYARLAPRVGRRLGWSPAWVSCCLLFGDSTTNRRRVAAHGVMLRAALPADGRTLARWLRHPAGELRAMRFVPDVRPGNIRSGFAAPTRVRTRG